MEGIREVAGEFSELRFALEYKPKEPRTHSFHARAADTLLMAIETGLENVGVCIDVGHSLMAGENVAESAVLLQHHGEKLLTPTRCEELRKLIAEGDANASTRWMRTLLFDRV